MRITRFRSLALAGALAAVALVPPVVARSATTEPDALDGATIVPISTAGPAWYDLAYHQQVMAAGTQGARLPDGVTMPAAAGLASPGIRPGQWLVTVIANDQEVGFAWCTANFVFQKSGTYGIGTAGHCAAKDALGGFPDVTAYVVPPPTSGQLPGFYNIGKFVLSRNGGIGNDFAMVQIYPQYQSWVNPTMPVWGGPTGVYTSNDPTVVQHFGHGLVVGTGGTPRAGVAPIWTARKGTAFAWYGAGFEGDSGSGVRVVTGEAAGNFTHLVVYDGTKNSVTGEILPGMLAGTRMTKILQIASGWSLVNGSVVPVP